MSSNQTVTNSVFEQIEQAAQKNSKFIKVQPGQTVILRFDPNKIKLIDRTINNKTSKAVEYTVVNVNDGQEKILTLALAWSTNLNELLKSNYLNVKVTRKGSGLDTSYMFVPA